MALGERETLIGVAEILAGRAGFTRDELAAHLGVSMAELAMPLASLARGGLVEKQRQEGDGTTHYTLSGQGVRQAEALGAW